MACHKGGVCDFVWDDKLRKMVCSKCNKVALYQPVDMGRLIAEHKRYFEE